MNRKVKRPGLLCAAVIVATLFFSGCTMEADNNGENGRVPIPGNPTGGPVTRFADGWASTPAADFTEEYPGREPGQQVSVTLTVTNGFITYVRLEGPDESYYWWVFDMLRDDIMADNTFEFDLDGFTGATYTSRAVRDAGRAALQAIIDGN